MLGSEDLELKVVRLATTCGISQAVLAKALKMSVSTLRRRYAEDMSVARAEAEVAALEHRLWPDGVEAWLDRR